MAASDHLLANPATVLEVSHIKMAVNVMRARLTVIIGILTGSAFFAQQANADSDAELAKRRTTLLPIWYPYR